MSPCAVPAYLSKAQKAPVLGQLAFRSFDYRIAHITHPNILTCLQLSAFRRGTVLLKLSPVAFCGNSAASACAARGK